MHEILISLMTLTLGLMVSKLLFRTINCPLGIFTIVWNGLFFLHNLNLIGYVDLTIEAILIIVGSYLFFLFGSVLSFLGIKRGKYSSVLNFRSDDNTDGTVLNMNPLPVYRAITFSIIVSNLGMFLWLIEAMSLGLSTNMYLNRILISGNINVLFSYLINVFSIGGSVLAGISITKGLEFKKSYLFLFLPTFIVSVFTGQRFMTILSFISFIAPITVLGTGKTIKIFDRKKLKLIIGSLICLSFFFYFIGDKRGSFDEVTYTDVLTNPAIAKSYAYTTGSFAAFSESLKAFDNNLMYGANTFLPFFKLTNILGITNYNEIELAMIDTGREFVNIPYAFNVYTYLLDVLSDWGYLGIIIFPFLLGIVSSYLWIKCKRANIITYRDIILTFLMLYLIFSVISSTTTFSIIWYAFFYAIVILNIFNMKIKIR